MARYSSEREFLHTLKEFSGLKNDSAFARACGQYPSNMSLYLSGRRKPGKRALESCIEHLYGWSVTPVREIHPVPKKWSTLPETPGIYVLYDSGARVIYIGKATNFRAEVRQTLGRNLPVGLRFGPNLKKAHRTFKHLTTHFSLYEISSPQIRHNFEALLLRVFANQTHNSNIGQLPQLRG